MAEGGRFDAKHDVSLFEFCKTKNGGGWEIRTPAPGRPSLTI